MKQHILTVLFCLLLAVVVAAVSGAGPSDQDPLLQLLLVNQNNHNTTKNIHISSSKSKDAAATTQAPSYIASDGLYVSGTKMHEPGNTLLKVGYLTAIKGELKDKQGLAISGAITLALDEVRQYSESNLSTRSKRNTYFQINNNPNLLPNVTLGMRWNDTQGKTVIGTRAMTEMICDGVSVFFGPEGNCYVEGIVSQSRNIPMISYVRIKKTNSLNFTLNNVTNLLKLISRNAPTTWPLQFPHLHAPNRPIPR